MNPLENINALLLKANEQSKEWVMPCMFVTRKTFGLCLEKSECKDKNEFLAKYRKVYPNDILFDIVIIDEQK